MSVTKDPERGTWTMYCRYKDWQGNTKEKRKRGFRTKKEAQKYENEFLAMKTKDMHMGFPTFVEIYLDDMKPRLRYSTYLNKQYIFNDKITPYFKNKAVGEITTTDILQWQNELLSKRDENGKPYSETYLRTINNQLSALFHHAVKYYGLEKNPCTSIKKIGKSKAKEMLFWTKEEYLKFSEQMKEKPVSFYAFELLYWCGIREGELLALTRGDFDLENRKLSINKSCQKLQGEEYVTDPKTETSVRTIDLPEFLCREMEDYFGMIYKIRDDTRLFDISKSYLHHEMDRGVKASGVKRIRVHDLRHSHVSYLINLGFSPMEIAGRLGHEDIYVTMNYAHLYPSKQMDLVRKIEADAGPDRGGEEESGDEGSNTPRNSRKEEA